LYYFGLKVVFDEKELRSERKMRISDSCQFCILHIFYGQSIFRTEWIRI